jgi:hypothetical protein
VSSREKEGEFVRFVVPGVIHDESQTAVGVVTLAYELVDAADTPKDLRQDLHELLTWFETALAVPDRFNRTKSKGWYRRKTRGISWLRCSAEEHVAVMRRLADAVSKCGHTVAEIRADRVGYVIYEDEVQVVAEPFRDTRTK